MITFTYDVAPCDSPVSGNACACDERICTTETDILDRLSSGDEWAWCNVVVTGTYAGYSHTATVGACTFDSAADFLASDIYLELRQEIEKQYIDAGVLTGINVARANNQWHIIYKQQLHVSFNDCANAWKRAYDMCNDETQRGLLFESHLINRWCDDDENVSEWGSNHSWNDFDICYIEKASAMYDQHYVVMWDIIAAMEYNPLDSIKYKEIDNKWTMDANLCWIAVDAALFAMSEAWCEKCNQRHNTDDCEA